MQGQLSYLFLNFSILISNNATPQPVCAPGNFYHMQLSEFIEHLLSKGVVTVSPEIVPFEQDDLRRAETALLQYHANESLNMPASAPAFHSAAGIWAAIYLYRAIQLTLLRNFGEEAVREMLTPFEGEKTAEAIYSADFSLRHLRAVLEFAKGLSPNDVLVVLLKQTAVDWPYSSIGLELPDGTDINAIMNDTSLKYSYIDKIIEARDNNRCNDAMVNQLVAQALGDHAGILWPQKNP